MGAVLREQNALPYGRWVQTCLTAKDDVDNVGAGRAAKGETLGKAKENASIFRRLLQKSTSFDKEFVDFTYYLFTLHLKMVCRFLKVISNSE